MIDYSSELPEECPVTLEHAKVHLDLAIEAQVSDPAQSVHDLIMAAMVLSTLAHQQQ